MHALMNAAPSLLRGSLYREMATMKKMTNRQITYLSIYGMTGKKVRLSVSDGSVITGTMKSYTKGGAVRPSAVVIENGSSRSLVYMRCIEEMEELDD